MISWNFLRGLFGRLAERRHDYVASTMSFMELDVERMKRRLNLEEEGRRRGERNDPGKESHHLDHIEQSVVTAIETEKRMAHKKFVDHLKTYGERIYSLGFQTRFAQVLAAADAARSDFRASVHDGADLLFQLRRDVVYVNEEIDNFKQEHRLTRMAIYPESRTIRWGIIAVLLLVESLLNGSFLARGHELGLLGGVVEALVIAAINILVGLFVGWKVFRLLVHRYLTWKLVGVVGSTLYFVGVFGFNLAVAHYRDALGGDYPEEAAQLALRSLLSNPYGISDIRAWLLFLMGCSFSIISATDGWTMDDPYPGYGALARRQAGLIEAYVEQKQILMADLERIRDIAIAKMESTASEIEKRRAEYHVILESRERLESAFNQHLDHLEQCGNNLLTFYREANRRARKEIVPPPPPPPEHFSQRWDMTRPIDPGFGQQGYTGDRNIENEIGLTFAQLQEKRQMVHTDYESAVFEYQRIDQLTPEAMRNGAFRPTSP